MKLFRVKPVQSFSATALVTLLFLGQVFSCCLVNQKLGHFVLSAFTQKSVTPSAMNACCAKRESDERAPKNGNTKDQVKHKDCCIQDANLRLPQIASKPISVPPLLAVILGNLYVTLVQELQTSSVPHLQFSSGPPLFISQLRILV